MKTYTIYWLNGTSEIVTGDSISNAFSNAGYGGGAIAAIDFYDVGDTRANWCFGDDKKWHDNKNGTERLI